MEQFVQLRAGRAAAAGRFVLDVVFPPACAFCDAPLGRARAGVQLCAPCESKIPWLFGEGRPALCIRCGDPMPEGFVSGAVTTSLVSSENEQPKPFVLRSRKAASRRTGRRPQSVSGPFDPSRRTSGPPQGERELGLSVAERAEPSGNALIVPGASSRDRMCGACLKERPRYHQARAACRYGDPVREAILALKYSRRLDLTGPLTRMLALAYAETYDGESPPALITAVPLHPVRLRLRHFDQARLLAARLAKLTGTPAAPDLLRRVRDTSSQRGLSRRQRKENVRGAFSLRQKGRCEDRHVLLVDDVYTTGATVNECTKVLLREGKAARVDVLCVARAVKDAVKG